MTSCRTPRSRKPARCSPGAEAIAVSVRANEQVIVAMSTEDLEGLRKDLADSVASASATIAEIKTLLAARGS